MLYHEKRCGELRNIRVNIRRDISEHVPQTNLAETNLTKTPVNLEKQEKEGISFSPFFLTLPD